MPGGFGVLTGGEAGGVQVLGDVRGRAGPGAPQDAPQPLAESEIRDRVGPVSVQRDDRPARRGRGLASQACREARKRDQGNCSNRDSIDPSARARHEPDVSKVKASSGSAHGPCMPLVACTGTAATAWFNRLGPRGPSHAGHETHGAPTIYRARAEPGLRHDMPWRNGWLRGRFEESGATHGTPDRGAANRSPETFA